MGRALVPTPARQRLKADDRRQHDGLGASEATCYDGPEGRGETHLGKHKMI